MVGSGKRLYLDYNASAPLLDEARDAIIAALGITGNPSSVHREGGLPVRWSNPPAAVLRPSLMPGRSMSFLRPVRQRRPRR
ncbi:cysteine desulfurase [Brucella neotomae]|nr:cysteine desulfurase [Brucella neotomae]